MVVTAYVLMISKSGEEREAIGALNKLKEVKESKIVYGEYDIVAKIQVVPEYSSRKPFDMSRLSPCKCPVRKSNVKVHAANSLFVDYFSHLWSAAA